MRKRRYLFTGMAVVLLFTILFAAGYTTPALGNVNTVQAAAKKKDISREGKKKRSIIKGKIFELEVDKPESVKDKNLTWSIKDSSIVTFAGKERHDDDIKFKALKAGTTKITCRNTKTDKKISFNIVVKNVSKTKKASSKNKTIQAKGSLKRSIRVNGELELEVILSLAPADGADQEFNKVCNMLSEYSSPEKGDSSVLAFEDMDDGIYDDEMEFVGIKPGKTTVTCTNTANKEKVTFTITVK